MAKLFIPIIECAACGAARAANMPRCRQCGHGIGEQSPVNQTTPVPPPPKPRKAKKPRPPMAGESVIQSTIKFRGKSA